MSLLLEPFTHDFIIRAIIVTALVGLITGVLSAFLVLKGWSLIGDALSHSVVPGVVGAYLLGFPFTLGAFFSGGLAASAMLLLQEKTKLRQDVIIGIVFTAFFSLGFFIASLYPISIDISKITMGNVLGISSFDFFQISSIVIISLFIICLKWRELMLIFFDDTYASSIGLNVYKMKVLFFSILAVSTVIAMQVVGAFLVIALVTIPGATAYLLTNRFSMLCILATAISTVSAVLGVYLSYFLEFIPSASIIMVQSLVFIFTLIFSPHYGLLFYRHYAS